MQHVFFLLVRKGTINGEDFCACLHKTNLVRMLLLNVTAVLKMKETNVDYYGFSNVLVPPCGGKRRCHDCAR